MLFFKGPIIIFTIHSKIFSGKLEDVVRLGKFRLISELRCGLLKLSFDLFSILIFFLQLTNISEKSEPNL